jgi:beta-lactamase class C
MTDQMPGHRVHHPRHTAGRLATLAILMTLTLGSGAQSPDLHRDRQAVPAQAATSIAPATPAVGSTSTAPTVTTVAAAIAPEQPAGASLPAEFDVAVFESMAQQLVADQTIPGLALAIVHDGRILSARGYGITDLQAAEPVDAHTVFRLASLSKGFAGTMAGLLVHDGTLRWDSKLTQYLPDFSLRDAEAARQLTVADVLSHRVGLSRNAYDRDLEAYVDYRTLTHKLANAPLQCQPGTCYAYQNVAFSLIGDVVFGATGTFYSEAVQRRLLKPLGMNDASLGLEGIQSSARWAKPHVRGRRGWVSVMPKPTYYEVAPAAGVNASASDMAQWLLAQTGHRPDVVPAPLLATLHSPLVETPSETRGSAWRRERLASAGYGLGWRVYDYAGYELVFHGGAVQGYRGVIAMLPGQDLGIAMMWNGESSLPTGLLPTMLDRALGLPEHRWMKFDFDEPTLYAETPTATPRAGGSAAKATAAPR